jgi:class 3 adenylate cyclase
MSKQVPPASVMAFLNKTYTLFDQLTDTYDVQKIETAGDCYVAASGILKDDGEGFSVVKESNSITDATRNAMRMLQFAKAMLIASKRVIMPHNGQPALIRIGLHTGDCVTGLVGSKLPKFSVFGECKIKDPDVSPSLTSASFLS